MLKKTSSRRSYGPIAIAGAVAVFGLLALLIVDHGPWNRPAVKSPEVIPYTDTAAAAKAAGATVAPTDPKPAIEPPGPRPAQPAAPN